MRRLVWLLTVAVALAVAFGKDPFSNKEDAVGYIVVDSDSGTKKFIVIEGKDGKVKLIKTQYEPDKVLKGGKKR
jgi:hypothetical protein